MNDATATIELGDLVRCQLTGLRGYVVGRASFLDGPDQVLIQPKANADGVLPESHWIPVVRVEMTARNGANARRHHPLPPPDDLPAPSVGRS